MTGGRACDEKAVSCAVPPLLPLERTSHGWVGWWWGAGAGGRRTLPPLPVPPRSSAGTLQTWHSPGGGLKNQLYHTFPGAPFNSFNGLF